uniref:Uncharacterized protein n=1 Tax=viral metagenome TaxID=1070528 RepID=A0A6C0CAV3_9ZZZZ
MYANNQIFTYCHLRMCGCTNKTCIVNLFYPKHYHCMRVGDEGDGCGVILVLNK